MIELPKSVRIALGAAGYGISDRRLGPAVRGAVILVTGASSGVGRGPPPQRGAPGGAQGPGGPPAPPRGGRGGGEAARGAGPLGAARPAAVLVGAFGAPEDAAFLHVGLG
ncbi:hypothetical protein ACFXO7_29965, partial [Nocardia tengchongensis]|uniref:hypothetical protein n=1 Tax=Nocardia tengchongensis TaxID=2055889 RepID=UPI003673AB84